MAAQSATLADLRQRLTDLKANQQALVKRLEGLERDQGAVDVLDPGGSVDRLAKSSAEAQSARRVLAALDEHIGELQRQIVAAEEQAVAEAKAAALAAARADLETATVDVVAVVEQLAAVLAKHSDVQRRVSGLGGSWDARVSPVLRQTIDANLRWWRGHYPELLGLPPLPTRREAMIAEARRDLERAEEAREQAKQTTIEQRNSTTTLYAEAKQEIVTFGPVLPGSQTVEREVERVSRFDEAVNLARRRLDDLQAEPEAPASSQSKGGKLAQLGQRLAKIEAAIAGE